jgi:hypothetical protein
LAIEGRHSNCANLGARNQMLTLTDALDRSARFPAATAANYRRLSTDFLATMDRADFF